MVAGLKPMDYETRLVVLDLFPLEYRRLRGDLILTYALFEQGLANRFFTVDPANTRRGHASPKNNGQCPTQTLEKLFSNYRFTHSPLADDLLPPTLPRWSSSTSSLMDFSSTLTKKPALSQTDGNLSPKGFGVFRKQNPSYGLNKITTGNTEASSRHDYEPPNGLLCTKEDVRQLLHQTKPFSALGPDEVYSRCLKELRSRRRSMVTWYSATGSTKANLLLLRRKRFSRQSTKLVTAYRPPAAGLLALLAYPACVQMDLDAAKQCALYCHLPLNDKNASMCHSEGAQLTPVVHSENGHEYYHRLRGGLLVTCALFEQDLANWFFNLGPGNTRRGHGKIFLLRAHALLSKSVLISGSCGFADRQYNMLAYKSGILAEFQRFETILWMHVKRSFGNYQRALKLRASHQTEYGGRGSVIAMLYLSLQIAPHEGCQYCTRGQVVTDTYASPDSSRQRCSDACDGPTWMSLLKAVNVWPLSTRSTNSPLEKGLRQFIQSTRRMEVIAQKLRYFQGYRFVGKKVYIECVFLPVGNNKGSIRTVKIGQQNSVIMFAVGRREVMVKERCKHVNRKKHARKPHFLKQDLEIYGMPYTMKKFKIVQFPQSGLSLASTHMVLLLIGKFPWLHVGLTLSMSVFSSNPDPAAMEMRITCPIAATLRMVAELSRNRSCNDPIMRQSACSQQGALHHIINEEFGQNWRAWTTCSSADVRNLRESVDIRTKLRSIKSGTSAVRVPSNCQNHLHTEALSTDIPLVGIKCSMKERDRFLLQREKGMSRQFAGRTFDYTDAAGADSEDHFVERFSRGRGFCGCSVRVMFHPAPVDNTRCFELTRMLEKSFFLMFFGHNPMFAERIEATGDEYPKIAFNTKMGNWITSSLYTNVPKGSSLEIAKRLLLADTNLSERTQPTVVEGGAKTKVHSIRKADGHYGAFELLVCQSEIGVCWYRLINDWALRTAEAGRTAAQTEENKEDSTVEDLKDKADQLAEQLAAVKTKSRKHARTSRCYKCGRCRDRRDRELCLIDTGAGVSLRRRRNQAKRRPCALAVRAVDGSRPKYDRLSMRKIRLGDKSVQHAFLISPDVEQTILGADFLKSADSLVGLMQGTLMTKYGAVKLEGCPSTA
ncbi:gap-Pol polyprotein, partial [Clonorchis sinensis]